VSPFKIALDAIAGRVPQTRIAIVMGVDGIPVEKLVRGEFAQLEAIAAEYTTLLRASVSAASDTGLGELTELAVVTDRMVTLLMGITPEYFLFAAFEPEALVGRARFAMRLACFDLKRELE